ncbi:DUF418 domain-containing protein [Leptospira ryugenii]|uniref:DUF418 domain-containing protein n=1 Tax=Leptospira ryugenii TaxID=1917863 RepID=UPI000D591CFD|nr:DUF418 domain-containing protein [Leptospira ryugenii]
MNTTQNQRLLLLDFLRGFALFGILVSNIPILSAPIYIDSTFQDLAAKCVKALYMFFVTGKFFVLFSFVFGYGFAILLQSIEAKGKDPKRIYLRRLFGLFILGLLHAFFLFEGDILVSYSLLGLMLYYLKDKDHVWKRYILCFWILSFIAYFALGLVSYYGFSDGKELANKLTQDSIVNHLGSLKQNFEQQIIDYGIAFPFILLFNVPTAAMMFLIGLWAGKLQIFADPQKIWEYGKGKKRYLFLVGTITNFGYTLSQFYPDHFFLGVLPSSLLAFGGISYALLYVYGIIYFLFIKKWESSALVRYVSQAGSMSLTNYLSQSLICTFIFDGWGLGYFSYLHPGIVLLLTVPIYGLNLVFSAFWKSRFELGPMEWLLRKWTYA